MAPSLTLVEICYTFWYIDLSEIRQNLIENTQFVFFSFRPRRILLMKNRAPSSVPTNSRPRPVHITDGVDATRGGRTGGLGRDAGGQDGDNAEDVEHPALHHVLPDRALSRH